MITQCGCTTWATDRLDLDLCGNGHHHKCPQFVAGPVRHVYRVEDGAAVHWFIATSEDSARDEFKRYVDEIGGEFEGGEKINMLPDDKDLTVTEDGEDRKTTQACGLWAWLGKPGLLCTTEY